VDIKLILFIFLCKHLSADWLYGVSSTTRIGDSPMPDVIHEN
jgi:hypothetical protein